MMSTRRHGDASPSCATAQPANSTANPIVAASLFDHLSDGILRHLRNDMQSSQLKVTKEFRGICHSLGDFLIRVDAIKNPKYTADAQGWQKISYEGNKATAETAVLRNLSQTGCPDRAGSFEKLDQTICRAVAEFHSITERNTTHLRWNSTETISSKLLTFRDRFFQELQTIARELNT